METFECCFLNNFLCKLNLRNCETNMALMEQEINIVEIPRLNIQWDWKEALRYVHRLQKGMHKAWTQICCLDP